MPNKALHRKNLPSLRYGNFLPRLGVRFFRDYLAPMLTLEVGYKLREYILILLEFAPIEKRREAARRGNVLNQSILWHERLFICIFGTLMFAWKINKIGKCTFFITEEQIRRKSKAGAGNILWDEVFHVQVLSEAYLIELEKGAIPIPFRCFNSDQRAIFEEWSNSKLRRMA